MNEVDTVGNERDMYRKGHFRDMQDGFRRLQRRGFQIRSHHGEVWKTLAKGIQAVDNAMNIWHLDNLEHGISIGINPNYYYHSLFQRILKNNRESKPIKFNSRDFKFPCPIFCTAILTKSNNKSFIYLSALTIVISLLEVG